jgi:hypothetical protein
VYPMYNTLELKKSIPSSDIKRFPEHLIYKSAHLMDNTTSSCSTSLSCATLTSLDIASDFYSDFALPLLPKTTSSLVHTATIAAPLGPMTAETSKRKTNCDTYAEREDRGVSAWTLKAMAQSSIAADPTSRSHCRNHFEPSATLAALIPEKGDAFRNTLDGFKSSATPGANSCGNNIVNKEILQVPIWPQAEQPMPNMYAHCEF